MSRSSYLSLPTFGWAICPSRTRCTCISHPNLSNQSVFCTTICFYFIWCWGFMNLNNFWKLFWSSLIYDLIYTCWHVVLHAKDHRHDMTECLSCYWLLIRWYMILFENINLWRQIHDMFERLRPNLPNHFHEEKCVYFHL